MAIPEPKNKIEFREQALQNRYDRDTTTSAISVFRYYSLPLIGVLTLVCLAVILWGLLGSVPTWIQGEGILLPLNNQVHSIISPDGPGIVINFHKKPGDSVKQGEVLVTLDKPISRQQIGVAQDKLNATQKIYDRVKKDSEEEYAKRFSQIQTQNAQIRKSIQTRTDFQKKTDDLLKTQGILQLKNLLSHKDFLLNQQNALSFKRQTEELVEKIATNEFDLSQFHNSWEDKLRTLELEILTLKKEINSQQKQLELMQAVKSPVDGVINFLHKTVGDSVTAGEVLATILDPSEILEVVSYVPAKDYELIQVDKRALVSSTLYKKEEYGNIEGKVSFISDLPVSSQEIMATFQNEELVKMFTKDGPVYKIKIQLTVDPSTPSGLVWTSSQGPSKKLPRGILVHSQVSIRERAPVSLIVPALRSLWGR